jgi:hypothetical protein
MRRTTVFLEETLIRRARAVARREGVSFAALVREAVARYVAGPREPAERLPSVTGMFDGGGAAVSERVDELLWKDPHS